MKHNQKRLKWAYSIKKLRYNSYVFKVLVIPSVRSLTLLQKCQLLIIISGIIRHYEKTNSNNLRGSFGLSLNN